MLSFLSIYWRSCQLIAVVGLDPREKKVSGKKKFEQENHLGMIALLFFLLLFFLSPPLFAVDNCF